ncbi:MAG: XRE family transcriptional regulator [Agathobacter sp.]|nr:XRE family transcriptional regulator [Agathobacter sp.]
MEKSTNELMNELKRADDCFEFVQENVGEFGNVSLVQKLEMLLEKYQKTRSEVIKEAGLDITYGYQIFDGRKRPRRDKLLQLAFGFPLTVEEANELLRAGGVSNL